MPSSTAIVLNSRPTPPAAATASATSAPMFRRCTWPGTNWVKLLAIATIGLPKSSSVMPVARQRARAPAMLRPCVEVRERRTGTVVLPVITVQARFSPCRQAASPDHASRRGRPAGRAGSSGSQVGPDELRHALDGGDPVVESEGAGTDRVVGSEHGQGVVAALAAHPADAVDLPRAGGVLPGAGRNVLPAVLESHRYPWNRGGVVGRLARAAPRAAADAPALAGDDALHQARSE